LRWRVRAVPPVGFILSPSVTIQVAGLALRVKVSTLLSERPSPAGPSLV